MDLFYFQILCQLVLAAILVSSYAYFQHGGAGHNHSHGGGDHGHSHGGGGGHGHSHDNGHGHSHGHGGSKDSGRSQIMQVRFFHVVQLLNQYNFCMSIL